MQEHTDCAAFFQHILLWSLTGLHYVHNNVKLQLRNRLALYGAFVAHPCDFQRFFTVNVRLLFFVVKEHFVFLVNMQPGLKTVLCEQHNWDRYETEIAYTMNKIRHIFCTEHTNPWTSITSLITKYIPRQIKCMRTRVPAYEQQLVDFLSKHLPGSDFVGSTLADFARRRRVTCFALARNPTWNELLCPRDLSSKKLLTRQVAAWQSAIAALDGEAVVLVRDWCFCTRVLQNVYVTPLPSHTVAAQQAVLRRRYDVASDAGRAAFQELSTCFVCVHCQSFRGFVPSAKSGKANCYAYGHRGLAYDYLTGRVHCATGTHRRRRAPVQQAHVCVAVPLLGCMLTVFGSRYTICSGCGATCRHNVTPDYAGKVVCGACAPAEQQLPDRTCAYCQRPCGRGHCVSFYCYNDCAVPQRWEIVWLCNAHRRRQQTDRPLLKSVLLAPV